MIKEDSIEITVPYYDCDPMGGIHHSNLIKYCEQARISIMKSNGMTISQALEYGYKIVTFKISATFCKPISHDDVITIETEIKHINTMKVVTTHTIINNKEIAAVIECVTVFLDDDLNPKALPEEVWTGTWNWGEK